MNIPTIPALDTTAMQHAQDWQNSRVKPQGALGELENLSIRLAGMTGHSTWFPGRRAVLVFAGDHGITAHPVSTVPQSITAYMVNQFLAGKAAVNVLARQMHTRVTVVDAGVNGDFKLRPTPLENNHEQRMRQPAFVPRKIARGTADFSQSTAMTAEQAQQALQIGMDVVTDEIRQGLDVLVVGEMGIGNTTSASAIIAAITGHAPSEVTGRGTGLDDEHLQQKVALIEQALKYHHPANRDTLMKVGGFEIGAMAGAMLYAASQHIPVILDGLICTAAASIAHQYNPDVQHFLIAGHRSAEPGHDAALDYLGLKPLLDLHMRLGEGTGALLALPIIEAAMRTLNEMGTLDVG
ncbi:MAG: nicotinate-nucleotide--dimethylbenzimidazole phosphoribosyltransferase [Anaerolineaceae bacterium]|nr:nicotinate-nucleotide--dimethylbenzimidazole phosphoribosyltransferase [Anaerolineaceae bacterium]